MTALTYLSSINCTDSRCSKDVKNRMTKAKGVFFTVVKSLEE